MYGAMYDAFSVIDGGAIGSSSSSKAGDQRMDVTVLQSTYKSLSSFGFAALQGLATKKDAKALFNRIDIDGSGSVSLEDWCEYIKYMEVTACSMLGLLVTVDQPNVVVGKWATASVAPSGINVNPDIGSELKIDVAEERGLSAASRREEEDAIREEKMAAREAAAASKSRLKMPPSAKTSKKKNYARSASAPRESAGTVSNEASQSQSDGQSTGVAEASLERVVAPSKGSSVSVDRAGMRGDSLRLQRLNEGMAHNVGPLQPTADKDSDDDPHGGPMNQTEQMLEQSRTKHRMDDEAMEHLTRECREGRQHLLDVLQLMDLSTTVKYAPFEQATLSKLKPLDKTKLASKSGETQTKRKGRDLAAAKIRSLTDEVEYLKAELAARETISKPRSTALRKAAAEINTSESTSEDLLPPTHPQLLLDKQVASVSPITQSQDEHASGAIESEAEAWAAEAANALLREAALGASRAFSPKNQPIVHTTSALLASESRTNGDDGALAWAAAAAESLQNGHQTLSRMTNVDNAFVSTNPTQNPLVVVSPHSATLLSSVESRCERKSYEGDAVTNESSAIVAQYEEVIASNPEATLSALSLLQGEHAGKGGESEAEAWAAEAANALLCEAALGASHTQLTTPPTAPLLLTSESQPDDGDGALAWAAAAAESLQSGTRSLDVEEAAGVAHTSKNSTGNPLNEGSLNTAALQKSFGNYQEQGSFEGDTAAKDGPSVASQYAGLERPFELSSSRPGRAELLEVLQLLDWDEATSPDHEAGP